MAKDINKWSRECPSCQSAKVSRHTHPEMCPEDNPSRRFSALHIDIVGPLPPSRGFNYLLTVIDRATRWPEAFPISDATSASCASAFLLGWIARFGVPEIITSDRGPQFISSFWNSLADVCGFSVRNTTAYHPQSNGAVERFHRSLKASLIARLRGLTD